MTHPVDNYTIVTNYGDPIGGSHFGVHLGTDYACDVGTPVHACIAGIVSRTGKSTEVGNFIEATGNDGLFYRYLHLSSIQVAVGDIISEGQQIALSGGAYGTDTSTSGPHLHLDIRYPSLWNESFNNYIDPEVYLKGEPVVNATRDDIIRWMGAYWGVNFDNSNPTDLENHIKNWVDKPYDVAEMATYNDPRTFEYADKCYKALHGGVQYEEFKLPTLFVKRTV